MTASTTITYDELLAADSPAAFARDAIERHRQSEMYRVARDATLYYKQRNPTIRAFTKKLYQANGGQVPDFTASQLRIGSNLFKRLNAQRCMYSLGKGVSFVEPGSDKPRDDVKERLGQRFDDDVKDIGTYALIHGVSFPFWNLDHVDVFTADQFAPVWDAHTGALKAGVRFYRIDSLRPLRAELYEEDGYTVMESDGADGTSLRVVEEKRAYKVSYRETPADGLVLAVDAENYSRLPIVPVWGSSARQSTLIGLREHIDAYDLIMSGFCNDVQDCAEVYWVVNNAGGMTESDLARLRDRMKLTHIVSAPNAGDEATIQPFTQDVPSASREAALRLLRDAIYEGFGALDVHAVAAGATNDHIDAAYQPMDEEADEFERCMREGIQDILALQGIEATPVFTRNRVSNVKEQVEVIAMEAQWLDDESILRKLPNVTPDEASAILERRDAEAKERMSAMTAAMQAQAAQGEPTEGDDDDDDDENRRKDAGGGDSMSDERELLNGAQTQALVGVVEKVQAGSLTEGQAANVISMSLGIEREEALRVIRGER